MANEEVKRVSTELDLDINDFTRKTTEAADKAEALQLEIDSLKKELSEMGVTAEKSGNKVNNMLNTLIPKFLGFKAVSATLKAGWRNALQMDTAMTSLNHTLGESSSIITDFSSKYAQAMSMSEAAILSMGSSLTIMLQNLISSEELIANTAVNIISQIEKIADATGRTAEDISNRYGRLIRGNLGAFRDLGIDTRKEYLMLTETFRQYAGDRSWKELTRNEQTQIALIETMKQVNEKFGENVDSLQDKVETMNARWEDMTATLGFFIAEVAVPVMSFFTGILQTAKEGFEGLKMMGDGFTYIVLGGVVFVSFAPTIMKTMTALFTGAIKTSTAFIMLGTSLLWFALIAGQAYQQSQKENVEVTEENVEAIEDEIEATEDLGKAKEGLMGIDEINAMKRAGLDTATLLGEDEFSTDKMDSWVQDYLSGLDSVTDGMDDTIKKAEEMQKTFTTIMSVILGVQAAFSIFTLIMKLNTYEKAKNAAATLAQKNAELAALAAQNAKTAGTATDTQMTVLNTAVTNTAATAEKAKAAATWAHNAALIAKIGLLTLGAGLIIGGIVIAASNQMKSQAPQLAHGGTVSGPVLAEIGEGQYSEAVVPLGNSQEFAQMKSDIAEQVAATVSDTAGGSQVTTIVNLDGREIVRAISEELRDDWRRKGWFK